MLHSLKDNPLFDSLNIVAVTESQKNTSFVVCKPKENSGNYIAMKVFPQTSDEVIESFFREIRNYALLKKTPYITPIIDFGVSAGLYYYVMPFFAKGSHSYTIREYMNVMGNSEQSVLNIFYRMLLIINRIHDDYPDFVHGDLKPDNFLYSELGDCILLSDFGSSKLLKNDVCGNTTYAYKAPELWDDLQNMSEKSDVYALGIILYEMLTYMHPLCKNKMISVDEWKNVHKKEDRRLQHTIFSEQIKGIIEQCLCINPLNRPSISKLMELISNCADPRDIQIAVKTFENMQMLMKIFDQMTLNDNRFIYKLSMINNNLACRIITEKKIPINTFETCLATAIFCDNKGSGDESYSLLIKALKKASSKTEVIEVLNNIALVFKHAGQFDMAKNLFDYIISIVQNDDVFLYKNNLALTYYESGDFDSAIKVFKQIIRRNPDQWESWYNLYAIYRDMGDSKGMKEALINLQFLNDEYI